MDKYTDEEIIELISHLRVTMLHRLSNPLKIEHLPTLENQIGYTCRASMSYFPMIRLTPGTAENIVHLNIPCLGVWLIHYEVYLINPLSAPEPFTEQETFITFLEVSVVRGNLSDVQAVDTIASQQYNSSFNILPGSGFRIGGSGIYNAPYSNDISFNIQTNFTGNIFLGSSQENMLIPYNLMATRIG